MLQVRSWLDDWETEATQAREAMAAAAADDYQFAENNPFLNVSPLFTCPNTAVTTQLASVLGAQQQRQCRRMAHPLCMTERSCKEALPAFCCRSLGLLAEQSALLVHSSSRCCARPCHANRALMA